MHKFFRIYPSRPVLFIQLLILFVGCVVFGAYGAESPPVASVHLSPTAGIAPLDVELSYVLANPNRRGTQQTWDFGDGQTSNEPAPTHTYVVPGVFNIVCRFTDDLNQIAVLKAQILVEDPTSTVDYPEWDFPSVSFSFNMIELSHEQLPDHERIAAVLASYPDAKIVCGGHTDALGPAEFNLNVSQQRAHAVKQYLVSSGIEPARLLVRAFGEERPVADNFSIAGRANNRRVELSIVGIPRKALRLAPASEYSSASDRFIYRVWYGTNRRPVDANDHSKGYTSNRGTKIHYGRVYVEIPESHRFGSVGSSWYVRLFRWSDDRLKVQQIEQLSANEFQNIALDNLNSRESGHRTILVYIHGYNTNFEEAAIRAAQIGVDLKVEGLTALFSWPSQGHGGLLPYNADEATIQASEPYLKEFLTNLVKNTGAERVDILAHSMGNRAFLRVVDTLASAGTGIRFGQIILAAPDVDKDTFSNLANAYTLLSDRTTLYTSSKDRALLASSIVHHGDVAGFYPPITIMGGIDTVKVTNIDVSVLGHGYFSSAKAVLYDIHQLLRTGLAPNKRIRLKVQPIPPENPTHWEIVE